MKLVKFGDVLFDADCIVNVMVKQTQDTKGKWKVSVIQAGGQVGFSWGYETEEEAKQGFEEFCGVVRQNTTSMEA